MSLAIRAGCDTRRGSDELVLENAIATCEKALAWGFTGAVLCRAAEAHLELSKVLSLRGEDQACLQSLLKAQQWLEEIEYTYKGYDHVKILKLELELDMARALANLGRKTQAKTKLKMIRNELPRQGRLREALEEQQSRLMDQNEQIDGPVRRSSVEAAPDRKIRLSVWRKAREEQQRQELLKRLREKEHSDDDDDEVEFVGQRSRADFIGVPDASGAGFGGAPTQMQPAPDAFGAAFGGAPTQTQPAPDAFGTGFGVGPSETPPAQQRGSQPGPLTAPAPLPPLPPPPAQPLRSCTFGVGPLGLALADDRGAVVVLSDPSPGTQAHANGILRLSVLVGVNHESVRGLTKDACIGKIQSCSRPLVLQFLPPPSDESGIAAPTLQQVRMTVATFGAAAEPKAPPPLADLPPAFSDSFGGQLPPTPPLQPAPHPPAFSDSFGGNLPPPVAPPPAMPSWEPSADEVASNPPRLPTVYHRPSAAAFGAPAPDAASDAFGAAFGASSPNAFGHVSAGAFGTPPSASPSGNDAFSSAFGTAPAIPSPSSFDFGGNSSALPATPGFADPFNFGG